MAAGISGEGPAADLANRKDQQMSHQRAGSLQEAVAQVLAGQQERTSEAASERLRADLANRRPADDAVDLAATNPAYLAGLTAQDRRRVSDWAAHREAQRRELARITEGAAA